MTFCPQHFTCRTCGPGAAVTFAVKAVGSITADPLSIEYPIDTAVSPAQVFVLALTVKGDVTTAPFVGVDTVMACVAGAVLAISASAADSNFLIGKPL